MRIGLVLITLMSVGAMFVDADGAVAQVSNAAAAKAFFVSEFPRPDPQVFFDGADWYIFGTSRHEPYFLQGKEFGEGKLTKVPLDLDCSAFHFDYDNIWGFVVYRHIDGSLHAYGTFNLGNYRTVIANFEPQAGEKWSPGKPITRWRFTRVLLGDPRKDDTNFYESKILLAPNKTMYLMYVASAGHDNAIYARRLKSWDTIDESAEPHLLLKPTGYRSEDRDDAGGMQLVEGGSIFQWHDKYILLYSVGNYRSSNYKLGMAFSDSLIPPDGRTYQTAKVPDPNKVLGDSDHNDEIGYLLQSETPQLPNYCGNLVVGPGLGSVVTIDGRPWLFFHGYKPDDMERHSRNRFVFRVPLSIAIGSGAPRLNWLHAELPAMRDLAGQR